MDIIPKTLKLVEQSIQGAFCDAKLGKDKTPEHIFPATKR